VSVSPRRSALRGPGFVLAVVWITLLAGALAYVVRFGPRTPYMDQWGVVVLVLTGEQPVTPAWLWGQHNEHRLPIAKLVETAVVSGAGGDFRAGMVLNVCVLAALALALALAVGRLRGRPVAADVLFPLLLLGWGQCETLLHGDLIGNVLITALVCVVLLVVASTRGVPPARDALLAGACLCVLPLCGAGGLPWVPPLALWLVWIVVVAREAWPRRVRLAVVLVVAGAVAVLAAYFIGFERPAGHPRAASVFGTVRTSLEFLAMSFGIAAAPLWLFAMPAILAIFLVDAALLGLAWRRRPDERSRVLGFAASLAALALLALEVGLGRAGFGPGAGLAGRYVILAAPAIVHAYLVWELYGPRAQVEAGRAMLAGLLVLLLPANTLTGITHGEGRRAQAAPFERDLRVGLPADEIGRRYARAIFPDPTLLAHRLEGLKRAGVAGFERIGDASELTTPVFLNQMTWEEGTGLATGDDPYAVFDVGPARFAYALRLRYAYPDATADASAVMELFWRRNGVNDFVAGVRTAAVRVPAAPEGGTVTVPIRDTIDQLRIDPDGRLGRFRLVEGVLLLVPPAAGAG
jgi:hypothetical protein